MTTPSAASFGPLLAALFDSFETSGAPTIPGGRSSAEVAGLLTRVMRDPHLFTDYTHALATERERRGLEARLLGLAWPDIPGDAILRDGFAGLPDDVLADLALSPEALEALEHRFYGDGPNLLIGDWLEASAPEEAAELLTPSTTPLTGLGTRRRVSPGIGRWVGVAAALVACLIAGIVLGTQIGGRSERREFALASVEARGDATRGVGEVELVVENGGDGRAFITVIGLFPERRRAVVFNRSGGAFVSAAPGEKATVKNLPPEFEGVTRLVVVLTGVPAGEAVRTSLPTAVAAADAVAIAETLGRSLDALNVRTEFRVVSVATGKN